MKNIKYIFLFTSLLILGACGYEPEVERAGQSRSSDLNTVQVLDETGYTTLSAAIEYAGLTDVLIGSSDSLTIFAPTNEAFNDLFLELGVSGIEEIPQETVADLLSYHVLSGGFYSDELPSKGSTLLNDKQITFQGGILNGKSFVLEGEADLVSNNSVIHGINRVLEIPSDNLLAALQADEDFSVLVNLIELAGLSGTLSSTTEYTVLAPTNDAFAAGDDLSGLPQEELAEILSFHVLPGFILTQDIEIGVKIATILGSEADNVQEIKVSEDDLIFNGASIVTPNILAENGVVHKVGAVIEMDNELRNLVRDEGGFGLQLFGPIADAFDYAPLSDISFYASAWVPYSQFAKTAADFANAEEATEYLENHLFEGDFNPFTLADGESFTSVSGSKYFMARGADNIPRINGTVRNVFPLLYPNAGFPQSVVYTSHYSGVVGVLAGVLNPLPEATISEVLAADADYSFISAAIDVSGRAATVDAESVTFFAINNADFEAATGINDVNIITGLDPVDDAATITALGEIIDRHTALGVHHNISISTRIPVLTTVDEGELIFSDVNNDGDIKIILDVQDPNNADNQVDYIGIDMKANNGLIQQVTGLLL